MWDTGISPGEWLVAGSTVVVAAIASIGGYYLLRYRVKMLEQWREEEREDNKARSKQLAMLSEVGLKLTVLNEQMERRIHMLEEFLILQRRAPGL